MAYVGLSRVQSGLGNDKAARLILEKAKALRPGASDRERRRITIREKQLAAIDGIEDTAAFAAYKKAIDDALVADLDDPQLWLLRGKAEESNASGRGQRGNASSVAFYERALQLVPDHASAHHYLVHSYETIGRIDEALEHGEAYARLSPAIPHAAHMWGHDLRRVGRIDEAIAQFLKVDALERAYYKAEKMDPSLDWHHGHNLDLLASCYEHKGQMEARGEDPPRAATLEPRDAYRAFNTRELPNFLIHRGRYAGGAAGGAGADCHRLPAIAGVGYALAGQALLWLGRPDDARKELAGAARDGARNGPAGDPRNRPRAPMVEPWVESLHGELLLRAGNKDEARRDIGERRPRPRAARP